MEYYNHLGEAVEYNQLARKSSQHGDCASVYFIDDYALKVYYTYTQLENRITKEIYDVVNNIDNRHLAKIWELLIERIHFDHAKTVDENFTNKRIDAYRMPKIAKSNTNFLDLDMNFILDMISELDSLARELSHDGIMIEDTKVDNMIVTDDNIVLIDWDMYRLTDKAYEEVLAMNRQQLIIGVIQLFSSSLNHFEIRKKRILYNWLLQIDVKENIGDSFSKILKPYHSGRAFLDSANK